MDVSAQRDLRRIDGVASLDEIGFTEWVEALRWLAEEADGLDDEISGHLRSLLWMLGQPTVTITFAGHFNSGKSTLLNAALGRALLPVGDLPETGVRCVLTRGEYDAAVVRDSTRSWPIPCTTEAIRQVVSLVAPDGERRDAVHQLEELSITVDSTAIPPLARWIDSPGINDMPEMDTRALAATRQADVLLWILSSRQVLSEVEMDFVASFTGERGPDAVVFVLNAYLSEESPAAWAQFVATKLPVHVNKVRTYAAHLGLIGDLTPDVVVVSGRAACREIDHGGDGRFGNREFRHLLQSLDSPERPRIQRLRLHRAAIRLRLLRAELERRATQESARVAALEALRQEHARQAQNALATLQPAIQEELSHFLEWWAQYARGCGSVVAQSITPSLLARDAIYLGNLEWRLTFGMSQGIERLIERLAALAQPLGLGQIPTVWAPEIRAALALPPLTREGASAASSESAGRLQHAADAGNTSAPTSGAGVRFRRTARSIKTSLSAPQDRAEAVRSRIGQATESAIADIQARYERLVSQLCGCAEREVNGWIEAQPDDDARRRWHVLAQHTAQLVVLAERLLERNW